MPCMAVKSEAAAINKSFDFRCIVINLEQLVSEKNEVAICCRVTVHTAQHAGSQIALTSILYARPKKKSIR